MDGRSRLLFASGVTPLRLRPRGLAALAAAALCGCSGGSPEPGGPPGPSSAGPPPGPPPPVSASPADSPDSARLDAPGETVRVTAGGGVRDGNAMADAPAAWTSDASAVANVDGTGLVAAGGSRTATVTVSSGNLAASATAAADATVGNASDREALVALYESAGGENWVNSANWLSERPLEEWHGVYTDEVGRIIFISMFDNGLAGPIPPEIEKLTALRWLFLDSNDLTGSLPPELGNLSNLEDLGLGGNSLSGPIPRELGNLPNLEKLVLDNNRLSGPIPPEIGALRSLAELLLFRNDLSGPIPRELGNLPNLEKLVLDNNRFSGPIPPELGNLTNLERLGLRGNSLSGPIPPWLGNLPNLQHLSLGGNRLSGPIPPELGAAPQLTSLILWGNELTGPIPPEIGNLTGLKELHVANNDLSGTVPPELTRLSLTLFRWGGNPGLCMPDTAAFAAWAGAIGDYAGNSQCSASATVGNASDREALVALYESTGGENWVNSANWLSDLPLGEWHGVYTDRDGRVVEIYLGIKGLSGPIPPEIGKLTALRGLYLNDNDLTGSLPPELDDLSNLESLGLGGNSLSGPIPPWLGNLPKMNYLSLDNNRLSGPIPPELGNLTNLESLGLGGNSLSGPIPPWLGNLPNLQHLSLGGNRLSGPIPPELGAAPQLTSLILWGNELTGPIPPEIGNLTGLKELSLTDNDLSGTVPPELTRLSLTLFRWGGNPGLCMPDTAAFAAWAGAIGNYAGNSQCDASATAAADATVGNASDREALVALYESTGGENWVNSANWLSDRPLEEWHGVYTDRDGRVVEVYLGIKGLSGPIPPEIGKLTALRGLYLNDNDLTGNLPPELGNLTGLKELHVANNDLSGTVPPELTRLSLTLFRWDGNPGLCMPDTAAFAAWAGAIGNYAGNSQCDASATAAVDDTVDDATDATVAKAVDREALAALHESTGGENWVNSANWLSDLPLGEWHGVYTDRDGRVVSVWLTNNGLAGPVPPEIGELTALREIYLNFNGLTGSLPPELGNLTNLGSLSLSANSLSGPIPPELGDLANLEYLNLGGGNSLSGPIPPELGNLANLAHLILGGNGLSGPIPHWLGNLPNLKYLDLGGNGLSGPIPPELGAAPQLTSLFLWGNGLTGPIPPELGNLAGLKELHLTDNDLSGKVPPELTRLPLTLFWWAGNPGLCMPDTAAFATWAGAIGDYGPGATLCNQGERAALDALYGAAGGPGWTNAAGWPDGPPESRHGVRTDADGRVTAIDLSANGLVGELPLELGDLDFLEELRLDGNPDLTGRLPYSLPRLQALSELRYAATGLCVPTEDFLREWLGGLPAHEGTGETCEPSTDREVLARFHEAMGGTRWHNAANWLTDAPLREWHGVDTDGQGRVTRIDLSHNGLSGSIPADIVALEELTELILINIDTRQAPIPPELGELANLTHLELSGIRAAGPFPPQLGKLARLRVLNLSDNELSGPIPPELGNLEELAHLQLDNNRLAGPIPHQLGNASALEQIHIANNELSGALPVSLAGLGNLRLLDLSGNRLSDYLPAALGDFERLEYLNLSYNDLFGAIPAELGRLDSLAELYLGGNALSGPVPPELGGLSKLRSLALTGNAGMEGPLPEGLAGLRELSHLWATGTKLCAPDDAALLGWLDGLLTRRVAPCGFEPAAAYLTQAIQSRELPIALVAGEEALLRVFPTAARANAERMPAVRADFYLGGSLAHSLNIDSRPGPIPTELDEGSLDRSVNAIVPAGVVRPGLEMVVEIDPDGTLDEGLDVVRRIPETGRLAVEVRSVPRFDVTFIPFVWEANPDTSVVELVNAMEADPEGHGMLSLVRTLLPVADIAVTAHAPVRTSTNVAHELLEQVGLIAAMEGATGYHMGLLSGEFEGASGIASLGRRVAYSVTDASVIAHEFGHNLSLNHTPCGDPQGIEPAYPHANASPGGWGYDFGEERLVPPDEYVDLMSYCSPYWVSDFSFDKALRYRLHGAGTLREEPRPPEPPEPVPSLLVWGGVDAGSRPFLEPALVVDAPPSPPRAPGPHLIRGADGDGAALFEFTFGMPVAADGDGGSAFAFALPVRAGWADRLASITLSGPGGSFTLDGDEDAVRPVTVLRGGPAGQVTGIVREPAAADALRTLAGPGLHSRGIPEPAAWSR